MPSRIPYSFNCGLFISESIRVNPHPVYLRHDQGPRYHGRLHLNMTLNIHPSYPKGGAEGPDMVGVPGPPLR